MDVFNRRKSRQRKERNLQLDFNERYFYTSCYRFLCHFLQSYRGHIEDGEFFVPVTNRIPEDEFRVLFVFCTTPAQRQAILGLDKGEKIDLSDEYPHDLLRKLWEHPCCNAKVRAWLREWLEAQILLLNASLNRQPDPEAARFEELQKLFKLTDEEKALLLLQRLTCSFWKCDEFCGRMSYGKFNRIACALGITEAQLQQITSEQSRLRKLDCLDKDLDFNKDLLAFLSGADTTPLEENYYSAWKGEVLPWEFFGDLAEKDGEILKSLLNDKNRKDSLHILLYGTPGTGKTSFAAALAAQTGRTAYFISQRKRMRLSSLQVCALQHDDAGALIVIDEADEIISCYTTSLFGTVLDNDKKSSLNDVLDNIKVPCVWIANCRRSSLDESNRRRFDYSIEFKPFTKEQRARIWRNAAQLHQIPLTEDEIRTLAAKYPVSAGGVELALRNFCALAGKDSQEKITKILQPHCQLLGASVIRSSDTAADYQLEGLNLKNGPALPEIVEAVRNFIQGEKRDFDCPRMNLLLSGPPGTGKTEFVKYLGQTLDIPVVTRMGSSILSKWVGGTEQQIHEAFEEAGQNHAILFFDEIDGLLQSRSRAQHSWEVSQVNELLQNMESFDGVMIGATNFVCNLDPAVLRRFTYKLEFDYLTDDGKLLFFQRFFRTKLTPREQKRLLDIPNLTPGDFRTVRQSLFYLGPKADNARRLAALEHECAAKNPGTATTTKIGFTP